MYGLNYKYRYSYGLTSGGASAWTPSDITTALWLDANDADTITEATGVSQWDDKSGNNNDVTQGTAAYQPAYNSTTKTITLDGSNDCLNGAVSWTLSAQSTFAVFSMGSTSSDMRAVSQSPTGTNDYDSAGYIPILRQQTLTKLCSFGGGTYAAQQDYTYDVEIIFSSINSGTQISTRKNGGAEATDSDTLSSETFNELTIGNTTLSTDADAFLDGTVREIIVVNSAVDTDTRQKLEGYLAWKWDTINGDNALRMALPSDHPYRYDGSLFGYVDAWNPSDITTALWLDASASDTITEATGVSQWDDLSGGGHDVTQGTGADQPAYSSANKTITFDGTDDVLQSTDSIVSGNPALTIVSVINPSSFVAAQERVCLLGDGVGGTTAAVNVGTDGYSWRFANGSEIYSASATGAQILAGVRPSAGDYADSQMFKDGTELTRSGGAGDSSTPNIAAGASIGGPFSGSWWFNGIVNEIVVAEASDTDTRQKLEGYLAWKWDTINGDFALRGALPSDHPYKYDGTLFGYDVVKVLDLYPSTAAYSVARLLRADYTGDAIRVRRSSDNAEQDIGFVDGALDTASLETFCAGTNGFVVTTYDQQGSADATQSTASNQPKIYDSVTGTVTRNGKPAATFDGTDTLVHSLSPTAGSTNHAITAVVTPTTSASYGSVFKAGANADAVNGINMFSKLGGVKWGTYGGGDIPADTTLTTTTQYLLEMHRAASDGTFYLNGASDGTYAGTAGGQQKDIGLTFIGDIQEVVFWNSDESANQVAIRANINTFYGVY